MIKKILIGTVLAGFIGLLIFGAVNRTIANNQNDTAASVGNGQGASVQEFEGNLENSRGSGRGEGEQSGGGQKNYQSSELLAVDWFEFQATVISVEGDRLALTSEDGLAIEVAGRPWRYAQEQGFVPQADEHLTVKGFYDENGRLEIAQMTNLTRQTNLIIRDANGRPMWAGQGNSEY